MNVVYDTEPLDALASLLCLTPEERELLVDHRIVGLSPRQLAEREGVSAQAIWYRLQKIDGKLRHHNARPEAEARVSRDPHADYVDTVGHEPPVDDTDERWQWEYRGTPDEKARLLERLRVCASLPEPDGGQEPLF